MTTPIKVQYAIMDATCNRFVYLDCGNVRYDRVARKSVVADSLAAAQRKLDSVHNGIDKEVEYNLQRADAFTKAGAPQATIDYYTTQANLLKTRDFAIVKMTIERVDPNDPLL